jgi:type IV pilus assembly protein PilV
MRESRRLPSARPARHWVAGFMMIEVLLALVVFSTGILGLVAAQGMATKDASSARFRALASSLAADLVERMWLSNRTAATLQASYSSTSAGAGYSAWLAQVKASGLPGVTAYPPTVTFTTVAGAVGQTASSQATIQVRWMAPGESKPHVYTTVTQLK